MEMTLGARLLDHSALAGAVAYETAMAQGMATAVGRILRAGGRLLARYAHEAARALVLPNRETQDGLTSYRRAALWLIFYSLYAWSASSVFRRGIRLRDRGLRADDEAWPLLARVLGEDRIREVHPLVVSFYSNPSRFSVRASLQVRTIPARLWSFLATFLIGQGLYETDVGEFDAAFRVFRREDGTMHFVRELYIRDSLRVFDSDFVVREREGQPTLYEVFVDHHIEVEMSLAVLPGGGFPSVAREFSCEVSRYLDSGLQVEFQSRVVQDHEAEALHIDGFLMMQPSTRFGRFVAHGILRRPEELAAIHYRIRPSTGLA